MTEAEWLACGDSMVMLTAQSLCTYGTTPPRKMRLFACGCCRLAWALLSDKRSREAVEKLEEFADDLGNEHLRQDAYTIANAAFSEAHYSSRPSSAAASVVCAAYSEYNHYLHGHLSTALQPRGPDTVVRRQEAGLLRDIFGNPFRPVTFNPAWRTDTALALARTMYESREFGAMPILADALQDAGCDNDDILSHCRDPHATHVRGCWVVDLVLGKE